MPFVSDFELRASDFRPKAGFGFVFSNSIFTTKGAENHEEKSNNYNNQ